jgi:hypothetical protein
MAAQPGYAGTPAASAVAIVVRAKSVMRNYSTQYRLWFICTAGLLVATLFYPFYVWGSPAQMCFELFRGDVFPEGTFLERVVVAGYVVGLCWGVVVLPALGLAWVMQALITVARVEVFCPVERDSGQAK